MSQLNSLQRTILQDWSKVFTYDFLTPEGKLELFKLATGEKFHALSPQKFAETIGVSRSTIFRMRSGEIQTPNPKNQKNSKMKIKTRNIWKRQVRV